MATDFELTQSLCKVYTSLLEAAEEQQKEREESGEAIAIPASQLWDLYE